MVKIRVGVLFGGRSGEHEVSLLSAESVMRALDRGKYEVVPIGITREGRWLTDGNPMEELKLLASGTDQTPLRLGQAEQGPVAASVNERRELVPGAREGLPRVDVVFPVLHGTYGEDGTVQGLLELANIPYVGSGVLGSALAMDKAAMKAVFSAAGFPMAASILVMRWEWRRHPDQIRRKVEEELGYPCFVKPVNLGSSVGISKVHAREELAPALDLASRYDRRLLVEQAINAREIECSVLGNDAPIASVPAEIIPRREFYDYEAKYLDDRTELIVPADLPPATIAVVQDLAVRAFMALDCAGMARADFFVDKVTGSVYINELNTIPGFTSVSMYPRMWEASGIPYPELLNRLIELAFERHKERSSMSTSYR
ncbi:MAG: D-alanine--D-alanine ligase [Chloroflexi bacterium ADurb.Bin180]|nr:MAG: D-alanine--D-alanine ligase [Chloroflexi bacterium ADurb.Bin180]HNR97515.1 D-alanine--D-alanine ligase family protein [Anaerolineae bacterium]HQJ51418.1 D-alanine--D-alanine ligase family protein [Anaerolineae bacterium]